MPVRLDLGHSGVLVMQTRRSLLAIFSAGFAAAFAPASAAVPDPDAKPRVLAFSIPRGSVVSRLESVPLLTVGVEGQLLQRLPIYVDMISTGTELVPWDSPEGQAIARETAVNLRSDGTIRHRQHHQPRD